MTTTKTRKCFRCGTNFPLDEIRIIAFNREMTLAPIACGKCINENQRRRNGKTNP